MCTFEPEKPEASVDRGARELPLSPGHDPSKTSSFFACNKRYVKCIKSSRSVPVKKQIFKFHYILYLLYLCTVQL